MEASIPHASEHAAALAEDESRRSILRDPWAIASLAAAFAYAALTIDRGWIPHDEGTLAQAALRVLTGELPHRDFDDMYTGGLDHLNVVAFTLFGIDLLAARIVLLVAFGAFLLAFFSIARRFASAPAAGAVVLLATVWSVPNYPAAMPTWYNLFLAVFALWYLLRFVDGSNRRWLFPAGLACGISICVKVVGLYTLAAMLIGLALVEAEATEHPPHGGGRAGVYAGAVAGGLALYVLLVFLLVRARLDAATAVHFVLPSAAVAAATAWRVRRSAAAGSSAARMARLLRLAWPLLAGTAIPVVILLVPYILSGAVGDLIDGTLVLPRRLEFAAAAPLPLRLALPALLALGLAAAAAFGTGRVRTAALVLLGASLAAVLLLGSRDPVYLRVWSSALLAPVLATLLTTGAAVARWSRGGAGGDPLAAALVAVVLGTFVLVQYPFSGPIYFFYVAPLVALCALAAYSLAPPSWRAPAAVLHAFAFLFGAVWVATGDVFATAQGRHERRPPYERLDLERGGLRVPVAQKAEYEAVVAMLRDLAGESGTTFVTPDAPEVYFLSGLRNPTRTLFDFFEDPVGRTERTLATLEREGVRVIALNRAPQVSGPPPADLVAALESRYPRAASVGRFVVRWR